MLLATSGGVLAQPTAQEATDQQSAGKAPVQKHDPSAVPDRYIVVLKDGLANAEGAGSAELTANEHAQQYGLSVSHTYEHALKGYAAEIPASQLDRVRSDSRVLFVSEDREVQASAQSTPTGIKRIGSEPNTTRKNNGSGVGVAVIDTGIDLNHPDLSGVQDGKNCIDTSKTANDDNGHGSHVAGTLAARNNDTGAVGVAPEATPYAVKVLNSSGSGTWSQVTLRYRLGDGQREWCQEHQGREYEPWRHRFGRQ